MASEKASDWDNGKSDIGTHHSSGSKTTNNNGQVSNRVYGEVQNSFEKDTQFGSNSASEGSVNSQGSTSRTSNTN